ncbi:Mediator of RNA polymerase II transcription subun it 22 [Trichuris trichiura]|uniref:Mediator of RNA polymerase II transcription subun it 22 n=1 Tax=Trichuris trichiura TaxID=36087 RepID=A0A077Z2H0_TRITR|nr:Mediator of RNA polymerase II transcription subun it 22 [Trichuris trichiura]
MKLSLLLCCILLISCQVDGLFGRMQRVIATGELFCGTKSAAGVKVKLIDIDTGPDDVMDEKYTDSNGKFHVDGQTEEITSIDPVLKIYHDCNDGKPGKRRWKLDIPKKYIGTSGKTPPVFDLGRVNLEAILHDEERDFI